MAEIDTLQDICVRRICRDVARHAVKWKAENDKESSAYRPFLRMHSDQLLTVLPEVTWENFPTPTIPPGYADTVNFILNRYVKQIEFRDPNFINEITAKAIINNCENLNSLAIFTQLVDEDFHIDLLKSLTNLVDLRLDSCSLKVYPVIGAITDCLTNLRILSLYGVQNVDDYAMFILSGHEDIRSYSNAHHPFVENCNVTSRLKLLRLDVSYTTVSETGLQSALTHIPTLRWIGFQNPFRDDSFMSEVIASMKRRRNILRMPLQLKSVGFVKDSEALQLCLKSCPELEKLQLRIINGDRHINAITGRTLNENYLNFVETFHVECRSLDEIFNEYFRIFWARRGSRIKDLKVSPLPWGERVEADFDLVKDILTLCPKLQSLSFQNLSFRSPLTKILLSDFPNLRDLKNLTLRVHGNTRELNIFAIRLILSASNLGSLHLHFPINETILPYLSASYLRRLNYLFVETVSPLT